MVELLQCPQAKVDELCGLATFFRQHKEEFDPVEMEEVQGTINFLIEKLRQLGTEDKITGKLDMVLPLPFNLG